MINTSGTFADVYTEEQLNYFLDVIKPLASSSDLNLIESVSPRVDPELKRRFYTIFGWKEIRKIPIKPGLNISIL